MSYKIESTDVAGSLKNGFGYRRGTYFESPSHWRIPSIVVKVKVINSKLIQEMYK